MSFVHSLCSSSKGNSTYIGDTKSGILVDVGVGIRIFTNALKLGSIEPRAIKAIFITHEHIDHVKGLKALTKVINVPIYGSKETLQSLIDKDLINPDADLNEINCREICTSDMQIAAFSTPHDTQKSLGFKITTPQDKTACICTDLGEVTQEVYQSLCGSDFILLESNYDYTLLTHGDYPYFLKQRIWSNNGHLSNDDCSKTLVRLIKDGTTNFLLGHLSEKNNRPELALQAALSELLSSGARLDTDYHLAIAPVRSEGNIITI